MSPVLRPSQEHRLRGRLFWVFLFVGSFSQVVQSLMSREMLVVFYGNEISLGLFLGFWLFWIAFGSYLSGRFAAAPENTPAVLVLNLSLLPAASAGGILLLRACRGFIDVSPAQFVPFDQLALWSLLVTMPVGVLVGAVFPIAARVIGKEEGVSRLYIQDALGGLVGGALFSLFLVDRFSPWQTLGLMTALLGLSLGAISGTGGPAALWMRRGFGTLWVVLGLAVAATPLGERLGSAADELRWKSILPALELVESFDTPYQNVAIARTGDQIIVVANGKVTASFPEEVEPALEAALLFALNPKAKRVLLVEGAFGGLVPELVRYPVERVDVVESDQNAFERVRPYLPQSWRKAFNDERVELHFMDPRIFFSTRKGTEPYDLIVALVPDPATAHLNRLFTREFYEGVRAALSEKGVFFTQVTSASNYLGREVKSYNASVFATLSDVFADVRVTPGDTNYFFASKSEGVLTLDPKILARRYMGVRLSRRRIPPQAFFSFLPRDRVAFVEGALKDAGGEVNTDFKPVTYYLNMLLWSRFSGSEWVGALETIRRVGERFFLIPLGIFLLLSLGYSLTEDEPAREARFSAGIMTAALGFSAMALGLVLLFTFQSFFGHVYKKVGLLSGLLMFGLALGAMAARFLGAERSRRPGLWLLASAALAAAFARAVPGLLSWVSGLGPFAETAYWGLVLAAGVFGGAGFVPAVRLYHGAGGPATPNDIPMGPRTARLPAGGAVGRTSGAIDSADHLGGALGALATGACLVPLFGVERSVRLASDVVLLSALPLVFFEIKGLGAVRAFGAGLSRFVGFRERAFVSFPVKKVSWSLAGAALIVWALSGMIKKHAEPPLVEFSDAELVKVSSLPRFKFAGEPFPHYRSFEEKGAKNGLAFATIPLSPEVKGYSGPINMLLSLSEEGGVRGLKLIESRETPSYIEGIDGWLAGFKTMDTTRPIRLGHEIEALSGATVTSRAVVEIVSRSAKTAGEKVLGLEVVRASEKPSWGNSLRAPKFWILAALLLTFFPVFLMGREMPRLIFLAATVGVMGFYYNNLFSLIDIANISEGRLPGLENAVWYLIAGFVLVTSLLWGQVYCGFVCPFGALQELLWTLGRRLGLRSYAMSWLDRSMRYMKFVLLTLVLILYWTTSHTGWITSNPMQHFFALKFSGVMAILITTALGASLFYFRFWCRYFCPTGALLAMSNKIALAGRWAPKRSTNLCDLGVRSGFDVDCVQCQRCVYHPAHGNKVEGFET